MTATTDEATSAAEAFAGRIYTMEVEAMELAACYVGLQLGYYAALVEQGPMTSAELAATTGTHERYAREWLEQQTIAGILATTPADMQRFCVPEACAELLVGLDAEHRMGATGAFLAAVAANLLQAPAVVEAFRSGGGVPYEQYGAACVHAFDASRRAVRDLTGDCLPAMPDVHERLQQEPPARVADIGCGGGAVAIAIAQAYPLVTVDGFDIDHFSVELAQRNAERAGVADRVRFHFRDAASLTDAGEYELVMSLASIHDFSQPVAALAAMRRMAGAHGAVFIRDPLVQPFAGVEGTLDERFIYSFSVLHCLPVGMVSQPSAGTGAAMTADTLRGYALAAGFSDVQILPIEGASSTTGHYRLIP